MAFQSAPTTTANNANQNSAQTISASGTTPAAGTWVAAPKPFAVNQPAPVGYPIG